MASASLMASARSLLVLGSWFFCLSLLSEPANGATCSSQIFSNRLFDSCNDLPHLGSYLHWTYNNSSKPSLSIAFVAPAKSTGWIAWAINPTGTGMDGSQSLIAYSNGTLAVRTFNITGYTIRQSSIAYEVSDAAAEYSSAAGVMRIFATLTLPQGMTKVNQVWQVGGSVTNNVPDKHAFLNDNLNSKGTLDLLNGESTTSGGGGSRLRKKNIHGVLNVVSWGILMPIGVIIARYLRTFKSADPAWFYLHASCQFSSYVVGVAGWATGLQLGKKSTGVTYTTHRNIGIALFCLASLQVFALFLRPKKENKYRTYWNYYHHSVGYSVIVLGIINIFKGLDMLVPEKKWRTAYITVLIILGAVAVLLEAITWVIVLRRKSGNSTKPYDGSTGANGYRGRQ